MIVTYTPEGEESQSWEFKTGRVKASEAEVLQKRFGGTWDEFAVGVFKGDVRARRVMLWHLLRLTHHTLRFEDAPEFYMDELKVEHTKEELGVMRSNIEKMSALPAEDREEILAALDIEIADAPEGLGKAPSKN
ncbi:hypothetical protein [Micromonospora matsumotoense]|uniref:hypothetical protein n=1 Tax=Micromonospora matsumotoense TaxID=121616 RepID=UPI0033ECFD9C